MKKLYLIGGTMGVGKSTVCRELKKQLNNAVLLDGDWCWDADPFQVTEETKAMVMNNICFMLNSFIYCSAYENVIFCWVMHEQSIIDEILSKIDTENCNVKIISLICSPDALAERLQNDINSGIRKADIIDRSINRLPLYNQLNTHKIDVSKLTVQQICQAIQEL